MSLQKETRWWEHSRYIGSLEKLDVPSEIKDLKGLSGLDLSYNNLSGNITSSLGEEPAAGVFCQTSAYSDFGEHRLCVVVVTPSVTQIKKRVAMNLKALVYEFMPSGSVHDWLHTSANTSKLNLLQRINILKDVATALDYLRNRCQTTIVHGDLKPSNILLDDDMVAHVGDFGLARLLGTDLNQNSSSGIKGTIGYAPPGKRPTDDMFKDGLSLHKFAYMAFPDHVIDIIDNDAIVLQSTEANAKKVEECLVATIKIGVSCSVDSPAERMKIEITVSELQRILDVLQNI
ncbi:leucine-rich repeat protein [Tanacetum coccineum]